VGTGLSASMSTPNNSKNSADKKVRHYGEYSDFVAWTGLPKELRAPKTQRELARKFGVGEDTLSEWKQREGFWEAVTKKRKEWGRERTPDVIHALFKRIERTGSAAEVRLWLEVVEGWQTRLITAPNPYAYLEELTDEEIAIRKKEALSFFKKGNI